MNGAAHPPPPAERWVVKTLGEVAEFFGVAYDTVRKDWREAGMPRQPNHFDLREITRWRLQRYQDELGRRTPNTLDERKLLVEIEWRELRNAKTRGELVSRSEAMQNASMLCQRVKARLEAFPDELEMELPKEIRHDVKRGWVERVYLLLKEMSEWPWDF